MAKTIVGLFDDGDEVQAVVRELTTMGIARDQISLMANRGEMSAAASPESAPETTTSGEDAMTGAGIGAMAGGIGGLIVGLVALPIPGLGPVIAAGPIAAALTGAGIGAVTGGVIGALTHVGVPAEHAHHYAEGVRRGGTLVTVNAPEDLAAQVASVMNDHHAVDVNERAAKWRESGWKGFDANAPVLSADEIQRERSLYANRDLGRGQVAFPVVEERLEVGKREVDRGAVRVSSRVVERPVEQQVQLRDEHLKVARRAVDRPLNAADRSAFREGTMEFKETVEEPVVAKTARVVEEVVVDKDVTQRTQTVRETVKSTEVDVDQDALQRLSQPGERNSQSPASPSRR
ncbi:MAG: YsnF/AvaK domain-containing protein [Deltaproteobacteria bacterium]|nr:YsnF/AvaK domain-containing protein [Myxococcales bacterium]MDP3217219.1 YsnF/AvaK domain-containing protein [Deltaproteobacteria bacterium]